MSDWDVNLIREFALRPIIYNKATPFFKNKYLTDCAWDEIAAKVGCDGKKSLFFSFDLRLIHFYVSLYRTLALSLYVLIKHNSIPIHSQRAHLFVE